MPFPVIAALPAALVLTVSGLTYRKCFYSPPRHHNDPHDPLVGEQYLAVGDDIFRVTGIMERYPYEDVAITAHDGVSLRGRYYHYADGAPLLILCHGYRSSALRDCSGGHALSRKLGFNALVIHQRCHGESGGATITFGIRERRDLMGWVRYACERFGSDTPILIFGLSMGAATALMGCELGYPENVAGIIADSPYAAPADIILKVCRDQGYPPALCWPFIWLGAVVFGRFRPDACSALEAVRRAEIPVLLLHGEDDRLVPHSMSRQLLDACASPAMLHTFPGAGHGLAYMSDPARYEQAVGGFLRTIPALWEKVSLGFKNSLN